MLALTTLGMGQWSADPEVNTLFSAGESGCVITHVAADPSGGCWVAWYDSGSGYDIRLQHVGSDGLPAFSTPILVSDQSLSWVQDFDLACGEDSQAVLVWASETAIGAASIHLDGGVAWYNEFGAGSGSFLGSPQVCPVNDGSVFVGWLQDESSHVQRVLPDGSLAWPAEVVLDAGGTTAVSDIKPGLNESVIVSCVHYLTFTGAKRLKAQRISPNGDSLWGSSMVDVFESGSLQFGAYPEFIGDGQGGAVLSWYTTSPLMARVQRVSPDGVVQWGTNGVPVTSESSMVHVDPQVCVEASSGDVVVFWVRQNGNQTSAGVQSNRFDSSGEVLWGATGRQIVLPSTTFSIFDLQAVSLGDLATASWIRGTATGPSSVSAAALDASGTMQWGFGPTAVGTSLEHKADLSVAALHEQAVLCWTEDRGAGGAVFGQNVRHDGTLGPVSGCPSDLSGDGAVGADDLLAIIGAWGPCPACPEDLNGDGSVGTDDLLTILSQWGPC